MTTPDTWTPSEPCPTFTQHADGSVTVDHLPERVLIASDFLAVADSDHIEVTNATITTKAANLSASYRIVGPDTNPYVLRCERIDPEAIA